MNLLTTKKAAAILGLTPDAIRYHERQGHILAIKVDRGEGDFMRLFITHRSLILKLPSKNWKFRFGIGSLGSEERRLSKVASRSL